MGITIKDNDGDLTGVSKKSRKAAAAKMGNVAERRAAQIKDRSESGFKGEVKNDHGLPMGGSEVIQEDAYKSPTGDNPKFRVKRRKPDEYASGVGGVVLKPKVSIASDATKVKPAVNMQKASKDYSTKLSKMNDDQLLDEVKHNTNKDYVGLNKKGEEAADSLATRNIKKRGGYATGTSGIKVKSKSA